MNNTCVLHKVNTQGFNILNPLVLDRRMTFGKRLRAAREYANLTQEQLGDFAGCGQAVVSKIERDDQEQSVYTVALARVCGVSADWLYDGTGAMLAGRRIDQYPPAVQRMVWVAEHLPEADQYRVARLVDTFAEPAPKNGTE